MTEKKGMLGLCVIFKAMFHKCVLWIKLMDTSFNLFLLFVTLNLVVEDWLPKTQACFLCNFLFWWIPHPGRAHYVVFKGT